VHALIGHRNLEPIRGAPHQRLCQRVALFAIELAHATNMRREMAFLHERANNRLLQRRRLAIDEIARAHESLQQRARYHGVADAQTREERLVERADVDHLLGVVEPLQRCERRSRIAELTGVVVLDDERAVASCPRQQLQASRHGQRQRRSEIDARA
jgi:hypothetical protein